MFNVTDGRKKGVPNHEETRKDFDRNRKRNKLHKNQLPYYFEANFLIKSPRKRHLNNFVSKSR